MKDLGVEASHVTLGILVKAPAAFPDVAVAVASVFMVGVLLDVTVTINSVPLSFHILTLGDPL